MQAHTPASFTTRIHCHDQIDFSIPTADAPDVYETGGKKFQCRCKVPFI